MNSGKNLPLARAGHQPRAALPAAAPKSVVTALKGRRSVYFEAADGYVNTAVYDRYELPLGEVFQGPAIIEEYDAGFLVPPEARAEMDEYGNIVIIF